MRDGILFPYLQSDSVYLCPTFLDTYRLGANPTFTCGDANVTPYFSYVMNASLGWSGWAGQQIRTVSSVRNPDRMMMYSEENSWITPGYSSVPINNGALGRGPDCIASFHEMEGDDRLSGRANVLFVDLHVDLHSYFETDLFTLQ